jgi:hypothetical protein
MTSERFLQISIPCNDCLVAPICEDKKSIDDSTNKHDLYQFMLTLRKWDESQKCYRKGLLEAWVNMGADLISNMRTSEFNDLPNHAVPEYLNPLIEIVNSLQWMVNSTSWREGKMYDFDKAEFKKKLKQAVAWV